MQNQLEQRLDELQRELETGRKRLRELETEQVFVRETCLRISGAIEVLRELLDAARKEDQPDSAIQNTPASP
jgi:predicted nuclease with TOPRIM domain